MRASPSGLSGFPKMVFLFYIYIHTHTHTWSIIYQNNYIFNLLLIKINPMIYTSLHYYIHNWQCVSQSYLVFNLLLFPNKGRGGHKEPFHFIFKFMQLMLHGRCKEDHPESGVRSLLWDVLFPHNQWPTSRQ